MAIPNPTNLPIHGVPAHIDCWIFDLDNTLYPPELGLFAQIDQRMGARHPEALFP